MKVICLNIVIGMQLFTFLPSAEAQFNFGIPLKGSNLKECRTFKRVQISGNLNLALKKALKIKNACKRSEALFTLAFESSGSSSFQGFSKHGPPKNFKGNAFFELNQRNLIDSLLKAQDTVAAIDQANFYLDIFPNSQFRRQVHYSLLVAQNARIRPIENDQRDTYIALGLEPEQEKYKSSHNFIQLADGLEISLETNKFSNPQFSKYKYRRAFTSFIEEYGHKGGPDLENIYSYYDQAAVLAHEKEFHVGMYYYKKKHYMAAIGRFKNVTNSGPIMGMASGGEALWTIWDKSAYYTALSFVEMGKALLGLKSNTQFSNMKLIQQSIESVIWHLNKKSMLISDKKIGAWLQMYPSEYTPGKNGHPSRLDLAKISFQNAGMIVNELRNERPAVGSFNAKNLSAELSGKISNDLLRLVPNVKSLLNLK